MQSRIPELDSLRGLAALTILVHHAYPETPRWGWGAVDLFFVLSGYLITGIIVANARRPGFLVRFYARRGLRTWPIYYLAFAAVLVLNRLLSHPEPTDAWPWYATYTQHLPAYWCAVEPRFPTGFAHTWSLAIEEQFYAAWPLLILAGGRRAVAIVAPGLIAVSCYCRLRGLSPWLMLARGDGLALGSLLAIVPEGSRIWRPLAALSVASLVGLAWGSAAVGPATFWRWDGPWSGPSVLGVNVVALGLIAVAVNRTGSRELAPLRWRPLRYLGQISYGLYLYHFPLMQLRPAFTLRVAAGWWVTPLFVALSLAVASASWHSFERPILALKGRFDYRRR